MAIDEVKVKCVENKSLIFDEMPNYWLFQLSI